MNRNLINLVLFAAVGVLTWIAIQQPGKTPAAAATRLTDLERDAIEWIEVRRAQDTLSLERRGTQWWLIGTPELPADPTQVDMLLGLASAEAARSYSASDLDLAQLGLEPAELQVRFNNIPIAIGGIAPLDNLRYVKTNGHVHLINDSYHNILSGSRIQLVSRKLLPENASILSIKLPELALVRDADGHWQVRPERPNLSADAINTLVQAWNQASALWVRQYQPDPNSRPIAIELADGKLLNFELRMNEREAVFARADLGLQYNLALQSAKALLEFDASAAQIPADPAIDPATGQTPP